MSSSIYKIKTIILLHLILMCGVLSGCKDDFTIETIGEGEAMVACEVNFVPLVSALGSRSPGTAIKSIRTLDVLIYDLEETKLIKRYTNYTEKNRVVNLDINDDGNEDMPNGSVTSSVPNSGVPKFSNPVNAEGNSASASFSLPEPLKYGKYHIYVVANVNLDEVPNLDLNDIDAVKAISLSWEPGTDDEPNSISVNDAMFGYFTGAKNTENGADQFEAYPLIINEPNPNIHAWIKRAASKVTIAFNGSGLNNDVHIYVKSVTLKNIPKNCFLGQENSPKGEDKFFNPSENFLQAHLPEGTEQDTKIVANSRFYYDSTIKGIFNNVDNIGEPTDDYKNWMEIINSGGTNGVYGSDHTAGADALYFYENNQGDYDGNFAYDKRQYKGDGDNKVGDNVTKPSDNDFRDKVTDGTYIEVEAYYVSNNPENFSSGPIRYRFMLGKNITYNYNAERNHHFKLTLGFKGWANQPDWHIEYDNPPPLLDVPETFRVSYVYNQSHTLPIRVSGPCTGVEIEITKNYWAPCDDKGNILSTVGSKSNPTPLDNDPLAFRWARSVFISQHPTYATSASDFYNCTGFLALQVECDAEGKIPTNILSDNRFAQGMAAVEVLHDYYMGRSTAPDQHKRTFMANENQLTIGSHEGPQGPANNYEVIKNGDNDITLLVPVFTRNKSIIDGTNYSGNNPFEEYDRYAEIKVTAHFANNLPDIVKPVKVLQTRRLVNPKGIWRSHDSNDAFHVQLATKEIGAGYSADYIRLQSDGSWTATIDETTGNGFFKLKSSQPSDTTQYVVLGADGKISTNGIGTKIIGKTNTYVDFYIDFTSGTTTSSSQSNCGVITVLYHNDHCVHKIMVRQGYNEPLNITDNGVRWSSFSVFGATEIEGKTDQFEVELTRNPLSLGSMIRRGRVTQAILVSNNGGEDVSATNSPNALFPYKFPMPFGAYNPVDYNVGLAIYPYSSDQNQQRKATWSEIGFDDERNTNAKSMGTFFAKVGTQDYTYQVPKFEDFKDLENAEYAYGVCYGQGANDTKMNPDEAFGFINPDNMVTSTELGMRGVFVYNPSNGNQIFFPIGKYGLGRRRMFNIKDTDKPHTNGIDYRIRSWYGTLWYGDTNSPLNLTPGSDDWYRPMAYNVCYQRGAIYWIDEWVPTGGPKDSYGNSTPSMGWDMNYYGFDFSAFTQNNWQDACIIKLVVAPPQTNP